MRLRLRCVLLKVCARKAAPPEVAASGCAQTPREGGSRTPMLKFGKSLLFNAPLEEVFTYAADPVHLPDYWVGVEAVKDIQRQPNGGYRFTSIVTMLGQRGES